MHYPIIIFAALTVSADTLATGIYLGANRCNLFKTILIVPVCSFLLCLAAVRLGNYVNLSFAVAVGGLLLVAIGMNNILSSKKPEKPKSNSGFAQIILLSLSLSVDNAVTAFGFGTFDYNSFLVAAIFSLATLLFLVSGILVSKIRLPGFFTDLSFVPGLVILLIGLSKILSYTNLLL